MVFNYLFSLLIVFYLTGAALSVIFNKKDRLSSYAAFLFACAASVPGIIFSVMVILGDTFALTLSGSSFLSFGFFGTMVILFMFVIAGGI